MKRFLKSIKLKYKLLLSYLLIIIFPLIIFSNLTFMKVSNILEDLIIYSATKSFNQATEYISYKIDKIINVSDHIAVNQRIKEILETNPQDYNIVQQHYDLNYMRSYLDSFKDDKDIYNICIYINDELLHSIEDDDILPISAAMKTKWYNQLPGAGSRVFLCPPAFYTDPNSSEEIILSVARRITNENNYIDITGYLRIDFLEKNIRNILSNANSVDGSLTYIRNRDDRIVSTTDNNLLQKYKLTLSNIEDIKGVEGWSILEINSVPSYVRLKEIPDTDWTIITVIPIDNIFREVNNLNKMMFIFLMIIIPVAVALSIIITYQITKRINKLSDKMKLVTENVFNEYKEEEGIHDEIGELASSYNYMVKRISSLAEEQYRSGQEIKSAELELLQAQINPHFLYNTMDMINWMSYENKGEEIRKIIRSLSTFYKLSLSKGANIITLKDELKHVSLYMEIQNYRLENKIDFKIFCSEHLLNYKIPKITLQPLVENAVIHGILGKKSKSGLIHIHCKEQKDAIIVQVQDDGIGISDEKLDALFTNPSKGGFGLYNIHTRLSLIYNDKGGLIVESEEGVGTIITVKCPKN